MSKRKRQLSRAALLTMAALTLSSAPVSALTGLTLLTAYAEEPQGSLVVPSAEAAIEAGFNTRAARILSITLSLRFPTMCGTAIRY